MVVSDYKKFCIDSNATTEEALVRMENNALGTLIVVNDDDQVIGTLTDGDVRKILLAHHTLLMPVGEVMNTDFISLSVINEEEALNQFNLYKYIKIIPVMDLAGKLKTLFLRDEVG